MPHQGDLLQLGEGYRLVRFLGSGTFGEVWQVEAPGGFQAAVKIIRRTLDHEETRREMASLEVIKRLNHPFLLKTQAAWATADRLIILMELADCTVQDYLKRCKEHGLRAIPVEELLRCFSEAAEALDYLHSERVLHRDVKPQNLLLCGRHIKVADFGLVRDQNKHMHTRTSAGTPGYMAPEVWKPGAPCEQSDQYSLAMAYAEMRLGRWPHDATDYYAVMMAHLEGTPDLSALRKPERQVLLQGLSKDPGQRFPTCQAFMQALREALPGEPSDYDLPPRAAEDPPSMHIPTSRPVAAATREPPTDMESFPPAEASSLDSPVVYIPPVGDNSDHSGDHSQTLALSEPSLVPTPVVTPPPIPAPSTGGGSWKPPSRRRSLALWLLVGSALLAFLLLAVVLYKFITNRPRPDLQPATTPATKPAPTWKLDPVPRVPIYLERGSAKEEALRLHIRREGGFDKPLPVRAAVPQPDAVTVTATAFDKDDAEVKLKAPADARLGPRRLTVHVGDRETVKIDVHVLPPGFTPRGDPDKKGYFERLVRPLGKQEVAFRLVHAPEGGGPFYLMENKLTNGFFREFAQQKGLANSQWHKGGVDRNGDVGNANDDLPVLRVTWEEARACAEWLGGRLPTPKELDVAAGYYEDAARQVRGGAQWGDGAAFDRAREGPRPVSKKDSSPSEIYDLAGNGREWTNERFLTRDPKEYVVELRGWSYTEPQPLRYDKLKQWIENEDLRPVQRPGHASFTTGFRVVIPVEAATPAGLPGR